MNKLTKKAINIPKKAEASYEDNKLELSGPVGNLELDIPRILDLERKDDQFVLSTDKNTKRSRELLGTYQSLIKNGLVGVTKGHEKVLTFKGIGYQAIVKGQTLEMKFGFSHPVKIEAPSDEVKFSTDEKSITVEGPDKQVVGDLAAKIRAVRPVDPYKQKGIKYKGERVIEKEGKVVESMEEGA